MWFDILKGSTARKKIDLEVLKTVTKEILMERNPSIFTTKSLINLVYPRYNEIIYAKSRFKGKSRPLRIRAPMIKILIELGYNAPQKYTWETDDITEKWAKDRYWIKGGRNK
jgi:hypothetical protein